jgi:hypothetical protein
MQESYRSESDHQVVRAEFNRKTGQYVYRARLGALPSEEWGILIGEIAHNLRSALDGLIYQLAALNLRKAPTRRSQFPVFTRRFSKKVSGHWHHGFEGKEFGSAPDDLEHQAAIERLQPYKRGRLGRRCVLVLLTEINNTDKHNMIMPGVPHSSAYFMGVWLARDGDDNPWTRLPQRPRFRNLKDGAKIFERSAEVHVNTKIIPTIAFGNECRAVQGKGVIHTFRAIAQEVSKIVESFGPEFP